MVLSQRDQVTEILKQNSQPKKKAANLNRLLFFEDTKKFHFFEIYFSLVMTLIISPFLRL